MKKFDVVIGTVSTATHPQHKFLPTIIKTLEPQPHLGDIYICEDGRSKEIEGSLKGFKVKHFTQEGPDFRLAKNINRGLLAAKRPVVCFMGDSVPHVNLLSEYAKVYEEDRVFSGVRYNIKKLGGEVVDKDWRMDEHYFDIDMAYTPWRRFTGNNWCASNELLKDLGGWNEEYEGYGFEDFEFGLRIYKAGYRFTPVPEAIVYHISHHKFGENEENQLRWIETEKDFLLQAKMAVEEK